MKKVIKSVLCILLVVIIIVAIYFIIKSSKDKALFEAIDNNNLEGVRIALDKGADINSYRHKFLYKELGTTNPTPLILACKNGNEDIVKFLLDNGADINKKDKFTGQTPLLAALHGSKQNRFSLAMNLIENGADIHSVQETSTPLSRSILTLPEDTNKTKEEGFILFEYLLSNNVTTKISKENALTFAAHYGNYNAVEYLIENEYYDINSYDDFKNTALIVAAINNEKEIVKLLLQLGAEKSLKDDDGKTAYDYAVEKGYNDIAKILK